jgi:hypothetical protein
MTSADDGPYVPVSRLPSSGNPLAAASLMFLGGYLLLMSFNGGRVTAVASNIFATFNGRPTMPIPATESILAVLQFGFAIIVVVAGILLARGSSTARLNGVILVVVGSLMVLVLTALRLNGLIDLPLPILTMVHAVFLNSWFVVVLTVGAAWLLNRPAGPRRIVLLGALVLLPLPVMLAYSGVDFGVTHLVMYGLSGVVGAAIIGAGRPWQA